MKKIVCTLVALIMLLSSVTAFSADNDVISVVVDGDVLTLDQNPIIENDRVLVPFRAIFEALGCSVSYNSYNDGEFVSAWHGTTVLHTKVGTNEININGEAVETDAPSKIVNGRTLVPVRAVSEGLGASVEWIESSNMVVVNSRQGQHKIKPVYINKKINDSDGTELINVNYSYPLIENAGGNAFIETLNDEYEKNARDYLENINNVYAEDAKEMKDMAFMPMEFSLTYDVNTDRKDILSITLFDYTYTGGAHPNSVKLSRTFDMKNGKELALTDVLEGTEEEVYKAVTDAFDKYIDDMDFSDDEAERIRNEIEQAKKNVDFYLTDDSLVLYFQVYEVAPYVVQYPTAVIPYEGNENMFKIDLSGAGLGELKFTLDGNPTTGYSWERVDEDTDIVKLTSDYVSDSTDEDIAGAGGKYTFTVTGEKAGNCKLELAYMRSWEGKDSITKTVVYDLYVSNDGKITVLNVTEEDFQ